MTNSLQGLIDVCLLSFYISPPCLPLGTDSSSCWCKSSNLKAAWIGTRNKREAKPCPECPRIWGCSGCGGSAPTSGFPLETGAGPIFLLRVLLFLPKWCRVFGDKAFQCMNRMDNECFCQTDCSLQDWLTIKVITQQPPTRSKQANVRLQVKPRVGQLSTGTVGASSHLSTSDWLMWTPSNLILMILSSLPAWWPFFRSWQQSDLQDSKRWLHGG